MVDTSTRGTLPARLAGQRSTIGSGATGGGGSAQHDRGGEGYYDPLPLIVPCAERVLAKVVMVSFLYY